MKPAGCAGEQPLEGDMACNVTRVVMNWMAVSWNESANSVFIPASGWMAAAAITGAKGWGEIRGRTGNLTVIPAVQLTNDPHDPGSTITNCGPTMTSDAVYDPNGVATVTTGSHRFIRVGWVVQLSAGTTFATGNVAGVVELIQA